MSKTSDNHSRAPLCAAFVKEMRETFGADQIIVVWVREGSVSLGEKYEEILADAI